jgi:glycerol-3-phosphate acyltransferase PlsY
MMSFIAIVIAYILGSIPSAYYAGKWVKGIDLRTVGSGNLGFTNALRTLGLKWSIPVLLFDILKGVLAIYAASLLTSPSIEETAYRDYVIIFSGLAAILGHNWTIFLGFKGGGKGVATTAGVFLALTPIPFLITLIVFLIVLFTTKYMSLASMTGALTLVISCTMFYVLDSNIAPNEVTLGFVVIAVILVLIRHISNIKRLLAGTENKFSLSKKKESPDGNHSSH